ncbi:MAG: ParB N-terminal domain-containing protein, partial [Elusimicrobiota bacterium]
MTDIDISKIVVKKRIRNDLGDIKSLQDSIGNVGLIHPIAVNSNWELITGYRRLIAVKNLGWEKIKATVFHNTTELDEFDIELQENLKRKDFNPVELAEALLKRKQIYEKEHPETKKGQYGAKGRGTTILE